ncbi:50S ribosomal protein L15e [Candidatus Pacearchaeota archaeon]|nr:50S ribosomal protein L15e [Candidatus Pacearchaeota archaeon]
MKSAYSYIRELWNKPKENLGEEWKKRLIEWRATNAIERVERPLRLDKARALGYKAKTGFSILRVRLVRGGRKREKRRKGRRSKRQTNKLTLKMNYQWVAEQRAARKYVNLEVLNSYWIAKDGKYYWYEVIMVDPQRPEIQNDPKMSWIVNHRGRAYRGLTSAAKKSRGLRNKGLRALKVRPSLRAHDRKGK